MRTGAAPSYPANQGTSYSVSRRSPARPYMICIWAGAPAAGAGLGGDRDFVPYAGRLSRSSLTQPHAELAKEFWAVVNRLQIEKMDALELIGHGGQDKGTSAIRAPA